MIRPILSALLAVLLTTSLFAADPPLTPRIAGQWWTIAGDSDLGDLTTVKQQPVDFAIWQAADGSWQLCSCIRGTKEPGKTRLFHRWEAAKLTDANWTAKGTFMHADPSLGETQGGLQAPYVLRHDGKYWMFYGDWANICLATSTDGKTFTRSRNPDGNPQLNFPGTVESNRNTRDPMVLRIANQWHCYYTAHPQNKGADYARTSDDLVHWSDERIVAARGKSGDGPYSAECPFVVEPQPGHLYLFRTQQYGKNAQTNVYHSRNPLDFGIDNDREHYVTTLPLAAPEIFQHDGQWYIAALLPSLKGIQIARLEWSAAPREAGAANALVALLAVGALEEKEKAIGVGAKPPADSEVIIDGTRNTLDEKWTYWKGPGFKSALPIKWKIVEDPVDKGTALMTDDRAADGGKYGAADIVTKKEYRDFRLHIEFLIMKAGGNSGVYLQNRYEIQVFDGDKTKHGMGAVINETESPYQAYAGIGKWNAYDITFRAARFKDGKRDQKAMITMYFNGQKVHKNVEINQVWGGPRSGIDGGNDGGKGITDTPGGLKLQCEGHDVRYRNAWIKELDLKDPNTDFQD